MLDNLIGGRWHPPESGIYLDLCRDPDCSKPSVCVARSASDDVEHAIEAAQFALCHWRDLDRAEREALVAQIPTLIQERRMDHWLDQCCTRLTGAKAVAAVAVDAFREEFVAVLNQSLTTQEDAASEQQAEPNPPAIKCIVISAGSSPTTGLASVFRALVDGSTVVVATLYSTRKQTAARLPSMLCAVAGCLPAGVINILMGLGLEVGVPLTRARRGIGESREIPHALSPVPLTRATPLMARTS
jgi:aldehyde dehydrogenase